MSYITNLPVNGKFDVPAYFGQTGSLWKNGHKGIDISNSDTKLMPICDGKVTVVGWDADGWGQYVSIQPDGFPRIRCILCHFVKDSVKVKVGQHVTRTTHLGTMGTTGNSTGVHVHVEIRVTDKNGKNAKSVNPAEYMGIPNKKATDLKDTDYKTTVAESNAIFQKMIDDYDGIKSAPTPAPSTAPTAKTYKKGQAIQLNKEPIYTTATSKKSVGTKTGTFYIYDGIKVNGRYRITNSAKRVGKKPTWMNVTGFVVLD